MNPASNQLRISEPPDYLVVGHVTADLTESGVRVGGTAAFSGLTAQALGLKAGIVTSFANGLDISVIKPLWIQQKPSLHTTTFKNISNGIERTQYLYHTADYLSKKDLPKFNQPPRIIHLGPVANEVEPDILLDYPNSLKCLTPQGWFRKKNDQNQVILQPWMDCERHLANADVAVISLEDVQKDETVIEKMAGAIPVLIVTENFRGARVYWHNDARFISAPEVKYVNDTGAGDIFAAAFFYRYYFTKDPWEAGRFAVLLASWSVTREYLDSIPKPDEIIRAKIELFGH